MSQSNSKKSARILFSIFIILTLLLSLGGNLLYRYQKKRITFEKHNELAEISNLKVDQIVDWRKDRIETAQTIYKDQAIITHILEYVNGINKSKNYRSIAKWINSILDESDYTMVTLIAPSGNIIMNTNPSNPIKESEKPYIQRAIQSKSIVFSDLLKYNDKHVFLDLVIPLYMDSENREGFAGVVFIRVDAEKYLYPQILNWPTKSETSEVLLVRREGDSVLYMSDLQHKKNSALRLHRPLTDSLLLVVQALNGKKGIIEGVDYRGVKVLGDTQTVPGSPWYVVTKVDVSEIYHPIKTVAIWIFIITFLLVLIAALIIYVVWTRQLRKIEQERQALLQHFNYVVKYANDIIILADEKGNIYEINDKAINTYGYTYAELLNLNLSHLRSFENSDTLDSELNMLNEKDGYIYETTHTCKNGKRFPVEVSGRIMYIKGNKYLQFIIRDITERKAAEEELNTYHLQLQDLVDEQTADLLLINQQLKNDIAERKLVEEKLRKSEQRLSFHFENSPLGVVEWDSDFLVTQWSKEAEHIFGWKATETIGKPIGSLNIIYEKDIPIVNHTMERLTNGVEKVVVSSNRNYTKTGAIIEATWYNTTLSDETGKMTSVMSLVEDITERKKFENELRKLSQAVEQSPVSIVITDLEGKIEYGNPKVIDITGYTPEELKGKKPNLFKSGETPDETYNELWIAITSKKEWKGEFHNKKKNGELYWEAATITPILDTQGNITHYLAIKEDITRRKQAEEELKQSKINLEIRVKERTAELAKSEERFSSTLDNLNEGCMFIGYDWTYLWVNDSITRQMGQSRERLIGQTLNEIFPGSEQMSVFEGFQVSMKNRIQNQFITNIKFTDGSVKWFHFQVEPVTEGIFVISAEITERILAEKALHSASLYNRNLIEASLDALVTIGLDGKITDVNIATENITGFNREKLIGTDFSEYFTDSVKARSVYEEVFRLGSIREYPLEVQHTDGHITNVIYNASLYKDESGKIAGAFAAARDITERSRAEKLINNMNAELELRVVQRTLQYETANKELEAFSYSVSHDLRAPLRSIDGWSLALLEDCSDQLNEQGLQYLGRVRYETQRMGLLIDDLLKLSQVSRTEIKKVPVDLSSLAQHITRRLHKTNSGRQIDLVIQPGLVTFGDQNMLEIALTNLFDNAFKFTSKQPVARIEFGHSIINEIQSYWIRDNGVGFDMTYAKNLFGAFQRFHKQSDFTGTGIGLATVQRIIHRHEGLIWAESKLNHGTTFYFTLIEKTV